MPTAVGQTTTQYMDRTEPRCTTLASLRVTESFLLGDQPESCAARDTRPVLVSWTAHDILTWDRLKEYPDFAGRSR